MRRAVEWLEEIGCDCGTDEPGTCALCVGRAALADVAPRVPCRAAALAAHVTALKSSQSALRDLLAYPELRAYVGSILYDRAEAVLAARDAFHCPEDRSCGETIAALQTAAEHALKFLRGVEFDIVEDEACNVRVGLEVALAGRSAREAGDGHE